jgi:RNA 2',3'-cyclic 3'-phosphodiesterase
MSSERLRLFVAADPPPDLLEALDESLAPLRSRPELASARWTVPANQHVTLKFLGWVEAGTVEPIVTALATVASSHEAATITLTGLGAFPSERRARVLWAGLEDPAGLLAALASDLDASLGSLGFEPETRAFTPHLTLARFKPPAPVARIPSEVPGVAEPSFEVDRLHLYRSHLHPKGARYEILRSLKLTGSGR